MLKGEQQTRVIPWRSLFAAALGIIVVTVIVRGGRVDVPGAGVLAAVLVAISFAMLLRAAVVTGSFFNGYTLVLAAFLLTYPVSALVHLTGANYVSLGFYEIAALDPHTQRHHVYFSLVLVLLAQLALWWGLAPARPQVHSDQPHIVHVRSRLLALFGVVFTMIGITGTWLLFSGSSEFLEEITTVDRTKVLDPGTARFVFMSEWLSWGILFALTAFLASRTSKRHAIFTLAVLVAASACTVVNLFWTGGRAENLLALLPLIFVVKKISSRILKSFTAIVSVGIMGIIAFETFARTSVLLNGGFDYLVRSGMSTGQLIANQLAAVLDWQMGRYPTISLAFDMVNRYGHGFGSTLLYGVTATINAPATLLHISAKVPEPEAMTALVGQYIYGNPTMTGVVPGTLAELYYNFGVLGTVGGFFVIGRIAKHCISVTHSARDMGTLLLNFYVLTLICLFAIPMTATSGLYFLATDGFPILIFCLIEQTMIHLVNPLPKIHQMRDPVVAAGR